MRILRIVIASALAVSAALLAAPALAGGGLFGHAYVSTSVKKDGKPYELYKNTKLNVDFDHESGDRDVVQWDSGCNDYGTEFEIVDERIVTGGHVGPHTLVECLPHRRMRQDTFFARFFKADPAYVTSGNGVKLRARGVVIKLQQRP